ncbi:MAG TPA: hypothetical protein VIK74_03215 [Parasegetibacter sp.]|jgi:O-antigen/teichoic acid export membrane protein
MLKRLIFIALFTGAGQLFSVFILKFISGRGSEEQVAALAQADSLLFFLINFIAMGLQSAVMRTVALEPNWHESYRAAQSARLMLSLLILPFAFLTWFNPAYIIFLVAPFLALSGDYALYSLGQPVRGAALAFFRTVIPFALATVAVLHYPGQLVQLFVLGLLLAYLISDLYISRYIKQPMFLRPRTDRLMLYVKSIPLGVVNLSIYFLGPGLLLIIPFIYSDDIVVVSFIGIKFYFIFKGVIRIMHQAFVREMKDQRVCLQVDQLSMIAGLAFIGATVFFPDAFIEFFFGVQFSSHQPFFLLLGVSAIISSFGYSQTTYLMLQERDKIYCMVSVIGALTAVLVIWLLSFSSVSSINVGWGLLAGECSFVIGMFLLVNNFTVVYQRFIYLLRCLPFLLIPYAARFCIGDAFVAFVAGITVFSATLFLVNFKKFRLI